MAAPIALALYTVRDALARDFAGTLQAVAALGYVGVETDRFPGSSPQAAARLCKDLGLTICAAHSPLPLGEKQNEVLDTVLALGCPRLICAFQPAERFRSLEGVRQVCDLLNEASAVAQAHGLSLGYHNHDFEFQPLADRPAYAHLGECLAPEVFFEIDTYWARVAGMDPAALVREVGKRAPLLHLKDGPGARGQPMLAVGEGIMDVPSLIEASQDSAEWLIVELDEYAGDMLAAVGGSYRYLVGGGYARGRS